MQVSTVRCAYQGEFKIMKNTIKYIEMAIKIAEDGLAKGHGPFGAVIVKDGEVLAKAANSVTLNHDPTAHAEVMAIREAANKLGTHNLEGCTIYTSCEPCPMCLGAIYWAGIQKVVFAASREDAAKAGFNDKFIYDEIALEPPERKVEFLYFKTPEAKQLFDKWVSLEVKKPY